jgi:hypothetical protein
MVAPKAGLPVRRLGSNKPDSFGDGAACVRCGAEVGEGTRSGIILGEELTPSGRYLRFPTPPHRALALCAQQWLLCRMDV